MKDPFNLKREMLEEDEALRIKAEHDKRFENYINSGGGNPNEYLNILIDGFFLPWESTCPIIARIIRGKNKDKTSNDNATVST